MIEAITNRVSHLQKEGTEFHQNSLSRICNKNILWRIRDKNNPLRNTSISRQCYNSGGYFYEKIRNPQQWRLHLHTNCNMAMHINWFLYLYMFLIAILIDAVMGNNSFWNTVNDI